MTDPDPATAEMLDLVLSVPCPECKRPASVRCITLDTHEPSNLVHRARALLWNQERDADLLDGDTRRARPRVRT